MSRTVLVLVAGVIAGLSVSLIPVLSQDGESSDEKWERLRQPGEMHKWLAQDEGEWEISGKLWVGPDQTIPMKGKSTVKMVFDRYAHEQYTLGEGDDAYHGFGYLAYDNTNEEFQALYCGTSGTGLEVLRGQLNKDKTVLTLQGEWAIKALGGKVRQQKVVITRKDKDNSVVEMFEALDEAELQKVLELNYKRSK